MDLLVNDNSINSINSNSNNNINSLNIYKEEKRKKKTDNCQELKNIAYKTMLMNGNDILQTSETLTNNNKITDYLDNELSANKKETWTKLNKTQKIQHLFAYVDNILKEKYHLDDESCKNTKNYLQKCIERKNLSKAKEIVYNKDKNIIENIPFLFYNEDTKTFILKKDDKHISTLKSLPPDKRSKVKTLKIHDNE